MHPRFARPRVVALLAAGTLVAAAAALTGAAAARPLGTAVKPYAAPVGTAYTATPLLSAGDRVQETTHPNLQYQMIGIPDGLGAYVTDFASRVLFMNHELVNTVESEPVVGQPLNRGAFVSKYILDAQGNAVSGERAYDTVYQENTLVGPAAQTDNTTPGFGRFCSGSLFGPPQGLDRWIYFTNEEATAPATFDPLGGQSVAIFDNEIHALPKLGHFSKENTLVMSGTGKWTVILSNEDGPTTPDSQLYLYVGVKDRTPGASVLARNGLDNGRLFVFASNDPARNSETTFTSGSLMGHWVEIPDAEHLSDVDLEAAADAAGAFGFVRIEDGTFNKTDPRQYYFDTTGEGEPSGNKLGRLYRLLLNPVNPRGAAGLQIVYNADQVVAAGGDIAISPDNMDASQAYLMVQEDGTPDSRPIMASKGRDGSIWRFVINPDGSIDATSATRVVTLNPPGRDNIEVGAGVWESSGVIDASALYGPDTWLFDVQAHSPTTAPFPNTVEDGQLVILRPSA